MTRAEQHRRHAEIIRRGRDGQQNKAIAMELGVSAATVSKALVAAGIRKPIPQRARRNLGAL